MRAANSSENGAETVSPDRANSFFRETIEEAAGEAERLKALAFLHLHEVCDWSADEIAKAFSAHRSTISRKLKKTRDLLHEQGEIAARRAIEQRHDFASAE